MHDVLDIHDHDSPFYNVPHSNDFLHESDDVDWYVDNVEHRVSYGDNAEHSDAIQNESPFVNNIHCNSLQGVTSEVDKRHVESGPVQNEAIEIPTIAYGSPFPPIPHSELASSSPTITLEKKQKYASKEKLKKKLSIHAIKNNNENRFGYCLTAISISIRGFQHVWHVVTVDGTFFKHKYGGILYISKIEHHIRKSIKSYYY